MMSWICSSVCSYQPFLTNYELHRRRFLGKIYNDDNESGLIRINKCFPMLSRREADRVIDSGRITVNGEIAKVGERVKLTDIIRMDGKLQNWQSVAKAKARSLETAEEKREFIYIKYWKPAGVSCTCYERDPSNIIRAGGFQALPQRIFPVGRLDKDSTGLMLLTSDGRINNALLKADLKREKVYEVQFTSPISDDQIKQLADGVWIETMKQRDSGKQYGIVKTLPCQITRLSTPPNHTISSSSSSSCRLVSLFLAFFTPYYTFVLHGCIEQCR